MLFSQPFPMRLVSQAGSMHLDIDPGPGLEDLVVRPSSSPGALGGGPRADVSPGAMTYVRDTDRLRVMT
jgi:hypothetical protein